MRFITGLLIGAILATTASVSVLRPDVIKNAIQSAKELNSVSETQSVNPANSSIEELPSASLIANEPIEDEVAPHVGENLGAPFGSNAGKPGAIGNTTPEPLPAASRSIQPYILATIKTLAASNGGLGYHLSGVHTEDIRYGKEVIEARRGSETMCVAAISEILIRAIDAWAIDTGNTEPYTDISSDTWMSGRATALRPWLYRIPGSRSIPEYGKTYGVGARDAFTLFGIGKPVTFEQMIPGDVIYFNRTKSGHAAIFLGYLGSNFEELETFSESVIGFRYFSAQSSGTPGLDYRHAYFQNQCPDKALTESRGIKRDCGIIRSDNPWYLSAARLSSPDDWRTDNAPLFIDRFYGGETIEQLAEVRYDNTRSTTLTPQRLRSLNDTYSAPIEGLPAVNFSGETID